MRVLVTGGTGFIGRSVVRRLLWAGHDTGILVEETGGPERSLPPPIDKLRSRLSFIHGDLRDRKQIENLVRESSPDAVIHLAAAGVTDPFLNYESAIQHNVLGTVNLVQAFFGTSGSGGPPKKMIIARTPGETSTMNVYAASKAAAWSFCSMFARTKDWSIAGAVIFQAFGPGQAEHTLVAAAISAALAGANLPMTSGVQEKDWIFVDDVAEGLIVALGSEMAPGISFDLGSGRTISVADMADRVYKIIGKGGNPSIGVVHDRPGEDRIQIADADRTFDLIGWRASTSVSDGLAKVIAERKG